MKTLKEIEEKIKNIRGKVYVRMRLINVREYGTAYHGEDEPMNNSLGWLVGLGMAKGIFSTYQNGINDTKKEIVLASPPYPKTPYEQGIKEALEWCLG